MGESKAGLGRCRNLFEETNISDIIPIEGLGFDLFSVGPPRTAGVYARYNY